MRAPHSGPLPLEQRGEHARDGAERTGCEIGDLDRRQPWCRVLEHARPAQIVEVVPGAPGMPAFRSEARDGAVHGRLGDVVGPDAEPRRDTGAEALEHDVRLRAERPRELRLDLEVADDRLASGAQARVPAGRRVAQRIALRRLDADDPRTEPQELPARVRAGEVAGEVDDEGAGQRLHAR